MFHLPSSIKIVQKTPRYGEFEVEGLYPGYGITIGNALRRVLLSSIEGTAVTSFKIKGVSHEFSTIPHIKETVLDISLNLKQLRVKLYTKESQKLHLRVKGNKQVTAKDFEPNSAVEIMNPELPIATITNAKGSFDLEVTIERGLGYVRVEERQKHKLPIGTINIDAIFTPITKVNFKVEDMRVGDRTDYNRLRILINTDGTIDAREALAQASNILTEHFSFVEEHLEKKNSTSRVQKKAVSSENILDSKNKEPRNISIEQLDLSTHTKKVLLDNGIKSLAGLLRYRKESLKKLEGLGNKSIEEIESILKELKYTLK